MARRLVVVMPKLKEELSGRILESAGKYGFEVEFYENEAEAFAHLEEAEVILGQSASLAEQAPELRWICTPSAGVNQFQGTDLSEGRGVLISNSSGAYGVTISEHIIMVTLEMLRRQQEYTEIITS